MRNLPPSHAKLWVALIAAVGAMGSGCATKPAAAPPIVSARLSPVAEPVAPRDAWRLAEAYAAARPGCEVVVGSGESMQPLYGDRTVLVLRHARTSELRAGMTVVFTGDNGHPVAHVLLEKTPRGWRAMGLGNAEPDRTLVRYENFIGVVIKAYAPTPGFAAVSRSSRLAVQ